ncbi:MAG: serine--tRNA ligase [Dehalococcoidia bacterium]
MLSAEFIREHPDDVRDALRRRHVDAPLEDVLRCDAERRRIIPEVENLKAGRNAASKRIGQTKDPEERQRLIAEQAGARDRIDALEAELKVVETRLTDALMQIPNMPLPEVPDGPDESANVVVRHGDVPLPELGFPAQPHWELGERLSIIDFDRGVKMSGSRFYVLKGLGARLQRALIQLMLDMHVYEHGLEEIYPPALVKEASLWASGDLPKFLDNLYHDYEDDLWLVPTAEVPITNMYRDEILEPDTLPLRYVAYTPCFRREKMSAGRDVRGIKRVHQFDKVEMFTFAEPEHSMAELERMLRHAEAVCDRLELPHRILQICTGDLGFKSSISYDVEVWAAGQQEWLEVSSVSNVRDFQARRANIRFRREPQGRPEHPHMLNGSGLALPRVVIAILENNQNEDGSVTVPVALRHYLRTDVIGNRE